MPTIVTGIDALGRSQDEQKLLSFAQEVQEFLGPEVAQQYLDYPTLLTELATAKGVNPKLIKSQQQIAQEAQAKQEQALVQQGVGPAIQAASAHSLQANELASQANQQANTQAQGNPQ